jgi:hypothetical protein
VCVCFGVDTTSRKSAVLSGVGAGVLRCGARAAVPARPAAQLYMLRTVQPNQAVGESDIHSPDTCRHRFRSFAHVCICVCMFCVTRLYTTRSCLHVSTETRRLLFAVDLFCVHDGRAGILLHPRETRAAPAPVRDPAVASSLAADSAASAVVLEENYESLGNCPNILQIGQSCQPICLPGFAASGVTTCVAMLAPPGSAPILNPRTRCVPDAIIECEVTAPVNGGFGDCPEKLPNGEGAPS